MATALDVELYPRGGRSLGDLVGGPVRVPRSRVGWIVGEQICVIAQLDGDCGQLGPDLVQVAHDQRAGVRVDGQPAVLVGLGVLTYALAAATT